MNKKLVQKNTELMNECLHYRQMFRRIIENSKHGCTRCGAHCSCDNLAEEALECCKTKELTKEDLLEAVFSIDNPKK